MLSSPLSFLTLTRSSPRSSPTRPPAPLAIGHRSLSLSPYDGVRWWALLPSHGVWRRALPLPWGGSMYGAAVAPRTARRCLPSSSTPPDLAPVTHERSDPAAAWIHSKDGTRRQCQHGSMVGASPPPSLIGGGGPHGVGRFPSLPISLTLSLMQIRSRTAAFPWAT
jgi:hypothetical protein